MKIWFDILHTPQYNFYRPIMETLAAQGHTIFVTVLGRGRTPQIMQHELSGKPIQIDVVGKHKMTKWSVIWDANLMRMIKLGIWRMRHKVDVCFTNGFQAAIWSRLFGNKSYTFGDDPDTFDYYPKLWFATKVHFCLVDRSYIGPGMRQLPENVTVTRCLKEWAALNPRTFRPNVEVLKQYGVEPKKYMFLREVSVGTINYAGQERGAVLGIKDLLPRGMKVLLSLEEKNRRNEYPEDWILLQEPVEDIHSLIYYSAGLVSSGDSMAREAALMGIPSYYLGIRYTMPANAAASKVAGLQNRETMDFSAWIDSLPKDVKVAETNQKTMRQHIDHEFIDINEYMLNLIEQK